MIDFAADYVYDSVKSDPACTRRTEIEKSRLQSVENNNERFVFHDPIRTLREFTSTENQPNDVYSYEQVGRLRTLQDTVVKQR